MAPRFRSFNSARKASSPSVWAYALFMLLGGIMAATFLFLGSILLVILTPIVIIAALILRWRLKRFLRTAASNQDKSVIDAEYTVIEERRRP
jgi:Flp pilus assembly protein TadB